jgi:LysM repeat protein
LNFTLQQEGKGRVTFPVNPEDYTVSVSHRNTVTNVIQVGDVNLMGKTGLREVSLSSFFPAKNYNFGSSLGDPISTVETIEGWRKSGDPCRVVIGRVLNMECTIESFNWGEQDATGDIYFTLRLKEYKRIKLKKATVTVAQTDPPVQRETKSPETSSGKTYTVKSGDCLWKIAKQFYGNGAEYMKIYNANTDKIKNPNLIYVGQVLTIP